MKKFRNSIQAILAFLVILILPGLHSFAQDRNPLEERSSIQLEKLYLHFDKPFYIPGETIWYKAYLVNARSNEPSSLSGIVYVELLDLTGKVIIRQILKAENGFANGEFSLPGSLAQGKYRVMAYTHWMRNFDQEFFFTREVSIYDPYGDYDVVKEDSSGGKVDLQFFPEGGSLVAGLKSKVAFKAINELGKGVFVKGEVTDQDGQTIVPFESFHLGMGAFVLKPEKGESYVANLISENGKKTSYALPDVLDEGLVMSVDNSPGDVVRINVQANNAGLNDKAEGIELVAWSGAQIYHTSKGSVHPGSSFSTDIPKRDLPTGIAQITLFNSHGEPLCERLIFVNHHDALSVNIETDKKIYDPREKVQLSIRVRDVQGNPVEGNFSLAVTDAAQVVSPGEGHDNILSNLLLTSEIKGNIEQPGFYFMEDNSDSETALDYLMLSQGWRRFLWTDIFSNHLPSLNYTSEKEHFKRIGKLREDSCAAPGTMSRALFLLPAESESYSRFPDGNGYFHMHVDATFGKVYLFYDIDDAKGQRSGNKIEIQDNWPAYQFLESKDTITISPELRDCLKRRAFQLKIASSYGFSAEKPNSEISNLEIVDKGAETRFFIGETDLTIRLDQYNPFTSMAEVFREVVPYVSVVYKKEGNKIRVYSSEQEKRLEHQPLFFVDGIPTYSKAFVLNLEPKDVESIGVINTSSKIRQFGFLGMNGIVAIYTINGTTTSKDIADQHMLEFQGCHHSRAFYSPVYESQEPDRSKPDLRSLLYWNPMVTTDSEGEASLSFNNTDNITRIDLRLEGISYEGTPGFADHIYKIIPEKFRP